jgi:hypothetical protein
MRIAHVCYRFGGSCAFCTSFDVESEIYEGDSFTLFGWLTVCIHSLYYSTFVSVIESAIERLNSVQTMGTETLYSILWQSRIGTSSGSCS